MKILVLDIETAPAIVYTWGIHKQHINPGQIIQDKRVLCFAAKWLGEKKVHFYSEFHHGEWYWPDPLWDLLDEADAVIHYNGTSFDIPHINTEFLLRGKTPPSPYAQIDLWRTVRSQFKFMSNKLDEVAKRLEIGEKAEHEGLDLWKSCLDGDPKAWARMKAYNIQDVRLTEALYEKLLPWIKSHPSVNLVAGVSHACPSCGSTNLQKRGVARTKVSTFQQWQCNDCGSYSRSGRRLDGVDVRGV